MQSGNISFQLSDKQTLRHMMEKEEKQKTNVYTHTIPGCNLFLEDFISLNTCCVRNKSNQLSLNRLSSNAMQSATSAESITIYRAHIPESSLAPQPTVQTDGWMDG